MKTYEIHEIALCFPEMDETQYEKLREDVKIRGVLTPLFLFEGKVLDGRHRYRAAVETGRHCVFNHYTGVDPVGFVVAMNDIRRHLTVGQRAMAASKLATLAQGQKVSDVVKTTFQAVAAEAVGVSRDAVVNARAVEKGGTAEEKKAVETGKAAVTTVAATIRARKPAKPAPSGDRFFAAVARIKKVLGEKDAKAVKDRILTIPDLEYFVGLPDAKMKEIAEFVFALRWSAKAAVRFLNKMIDGRTRVDDLISWCQRGGGKFECVVNTYSIKVVKL